MVTFCCRFAVAVCLAVVCRGAVPEFQRDIAPIFEKSCGTCHIGASMGKLRLDSEASVLRGGASGPAIVPGRSGDSVLVKRLLGVGGVARMPMGGQPLTAAQVDLIRQWIDSGSFDAKPQEASSAASSVFAQQVRPILAARCYSCHGSEVQQSGLRLDSLAAVLKGSDYGPIVVPGKADKSRLMRRLMAQDRPQMPYGGPPLSGDEIATISQWIDAGAPGPDDATPLAAVKTKKHWAYVKPVRPELPAVKDAAWVRNPIDNFILARLEKEGLTPSPEANKTTLLRRVYLDLTGLPPTPKQVDAFLSDQRPDVYERVVDELLASPHYGEKWARLWLDLARYADSNGYEKDRRRTAWEYRDWVIRALNADLSFRDFTIDQIAGDMLPNPTQDQLIATGFNRNSMLNQEGGIDVNEYYYYSLVDRTNTTASVWLGSTLGCAQCHNHKFDPFPQKDYYKFLAFFSNSQHFVEGSGDRWMMEPQLPLPTPEQAAKSKEVKAQISALQAKLDTQTPELDTAQASWEQAMRNAPKDWTVLTPTNAKSLGGATLKVLADGSVLASGSNPQADTYVLEVPLTRSGVTGVRLEVMPDASLPHGGPGRDSAGNFFLSDFEVSESQWKSVVADDAQDGYSASNLVQKKAGQLAGWAISEGESTPLVRQAVFIPAKAFGAGTLDHHDEASDAACVQKYRTVSDFGDYGLESGVYCEGSGGCSAVAGYRRDAQRTQSQKDKVSAAYRVVSPLLDSTREQMAGLQKQMEALGIVTAMVMNEEPSFARPGGVYSRARHVYQPW